MTAELLRLHPQPRQAQAVVARAEAGAACVVRLESGVELPVLGHLAQVTALEAGDPVLISVLGEGVVVLGRLRRPQESPAALIQHSGQGLELDGGERLLLRAGKARVELRADGRILVDGREIYIFAEGRLCLQGATIELN